MSNLKLKHTPQSYAEALEALNGRDSMSIGHNTRLERRDLAVYATYHGNDIVEYMADSVSVSWAGWVTNTTTNRLHMLAPARFNISKGEPCINGKPVEGSYRDWYKVA